MIDIKALTVTFLMVSVALAGCADKEDPNSGEDPEEDLNTGRISGLLVDDNFRPVQLKEEWAGEPGDYQDEGFILVVETAERVETNENGEFEVSGLDPGRYTLRVAAQAHEAIDQTVDVAAGESTAITLEARRKVAENNPILTIEYSGFVPCAATAVTFDCTSDITGESYRAGPLEDYRKPYGTDAHYLVVEAVTNQEGVFVLEFRENDPAGGGVGAVFGDDYADDPSNPYMKLVLENSAVYSEQHNPRFKGQQTDEDVVCFDEQLESHEEGDYCSWPNPFPESEDESYPDVEALVFYLGDEDQSGQIGFQPSARAGIKVNYIISIFLGEPTPTDDTPEDDLEDYCVYCKGYLDEL